LVSPEAELPKAKGGAFYHVRIKPGQVGRFVLVPGDPDRVVLIANYLEDAEKISEHREFTIYNGYVMKELVTVVSSGIGSPAVAIVLEELARAGAETFIRVGTCGAIQHRIKLGDLIIPCAAVRMEGTSSQYVPDGYPAVSSPEVTLSLAAASRNLGYRYHLGVCASTDSFYVGQGRLGFRNFQTKHSTTLVRNLSRANVLCFEMEASALFTIAGVYGLKAGAILTVIANRITGKFSVSGVERAVEAAVNALKLLIKWRREATERHSENWIPLLE